MTMPVQEEHKDMIKKNPPKLNFDLWTTLLY